MHSLPLFNALKLLIKQDLLKAVFNPVYEAQEHPNLEYGMQAYSPNLIADIYSSELNQGLDTRLVNCIRHLPYEE